MALAGCCAQDVVTPPGPGEDAAASTQDDARAAGDRDAAPGIDATNSDAGAMFLDAMTAMNADAAMSSLACHVDRFMVCEDLEEATSTNDEASDASNLNASSPGCINGDNFSAGGFMHTSRICPVEAADWYSTNFVHCDSITYFAEYRLHPLTPCEPGALRLEVQGRNCADPTVRCTTTGADQSIIFEVPPGNMVGSFKAGVIRVATDVKIDYELTYSVRR